MHLQQTGVLAEGTDDMQTDAAEAADSNVVMQESENLGQGSNATQTEEEVREQIQARLPGTEWKARIGAAGTSMEQQRVSPIVELSMLLVSHCFS